jgi:prepilin-type N-terminal cleavage/methylation domain-containing protein
MKRLAGFTLVEMLVVVAIIAVLAAILIPVVFNAREAGWKAQCISQMAEVGRAVAMYKQDYGVYPDNAAPMQKLVNAKLLGAVPSCPKDRVDKHDSYGEYYNYWGYAVGSLSPEPLKTRADAEATYSTLTNPKTGKQDFWSAADATLVVESAGGMGTDFPGLANAQAGGTTIITACPHHTTKFSGKYVIIRLSGTASTGPGTTDFYCPTEQDFWVLSKKVK